MTNNLHIVRRSRRALACASILAAGLATLSQPGISQAGAPAAVTQRA